MLVCAYSRIKVAKDENRITDEDVMNDSLQFFIEFLLLFSLSDSLRA